MTPEGKIKAKVNKALATLPKCYRFCPVQNGMGSPGLDYYCCINGQFVAIETKASGKSLTTRQWNTAEKIISGGGLVFVIHDEDEIREMIRELTRL